MSGWLAPLVRTYESVWARMRRAEPPESLVTVGNAGVVASLCGVGIGRDGSGNGRRDRAREVYRDLLAAGTPTP
jgi:hypothetical protein